MSILSYEELKARAKQPKQIDVPGLGTIYVKRFTANDLKAFAGKQDEDELRTIVADFVVNEDGTPLFTADELADVAVEDLFAIGQAINDDLQKKIGPVTK